MCFFERLLWLRTSYYWYSCCCDMCHFKLFQVSVTQVTLPAQPYWSLWNGNSLIYLLMMQSQKYDFHHNNKYHLCTTWEFMKRLNIYFTSLHRWSNGREQARRQIRELTSVIKETKIMSDYRHLEHLQPAIKKKFPVVFCWKWTISTSCRRKCSLVL